MLVGACQHIGTPLCYILHDQVKSRKKCIIVSIIVIFKCCGEWMGQEFGFENRPEEINQKIHTQARPQDLTHMVGPTPTK